MGICPAGSSPETNNLRTLLKGNESADADREIYTSMHELTAFFERERDYVEVGISIGMILYLTFHSGAIVSNFCGYQYNGRCPY